MSEVLLDQFRGMIIAFITMDDYTDEIKIDEIIRQTAEIPIFKSKITEEEVKIIRNQIHADCLIRLDNGVGLISHKHTKWFKAKKANLDMKYWNRYKRYLSQDKKFPLPVINTMDDVSDELTDLLGEPTKEESFQRRGLIIGDVQSGKTANYTGLICKAADSGYKVIVLLTGTIEKLRKQTQMRLDEGFIGMDSSAMIKKKANVYVGVGKYDYTLHPMVLTSNASDFNTNVANNLGFTLNSLNEPVLFVIKKNVSVLRRLNDWLKLFNLNGNTHINTSLLMIDDESDNASVNTNAIDREPTLTNALIVEMLNLFTKASYVGFTATPFANIFIDPETDEEMKKENLFPRDYIYSLNAPSNYIGARDIYGVNAKYSNMLRVIEDGEDFFPMSHKIDFMVEELSESLKEAINTFIIANVIRDLRGDIKEHRSMIVNISRFVKVQSQFGELINNYLKQIQSSARIYGQLPVFSALHDVSLNSLYETFMREYLSLNYSWETIQSKLSSSIESIEVVVVNQKNYNRLNYEENEANGLRAITVGGLSLSRGLTLEGLMTSYFYRNSKMYDTLMQMGRWFGYRKNYDDLCRIWMNDENINWYQHISDSTDELRNDIKEMRDQGATPLEFGLRVRNDIDSLLVTARNKMRTAKQITKTISLSGEFVETPKLFNDVSKNMNNFKLIKNLINELANEKIEKLGNLCGFTNISSEYILRFLKNLNVSYTNLTFDTHTIINFINNYKGNELEKWDIVFINGESTKHFKIRDGYEINCIERKFDLKNENKIIQISGTRNRLGSMGDSKFGLTVEQLKNLKKEYETNHDKNKSMGQKFYFSKYVKRNPLLMIYMIDLKNNEKNTLTKFEEEPLVGISIGIPWLTDETTKYAHYQINKVALDNLEEFDNKIEDEEYD